MSIKGSGDFVPDYTPKNGYFDKAAEEKATRKVDKRANAWKKDAKHSTDKLIKGSLHERIVEDYKPRNISPLKGSLEPVPEAPKREPVDPTIPTDMPPPLPDELKVHDKAPEVAGRILKTKKSVTVKKEHKTHEETELTHNPLLMKMRKKADYEGIIKQSPEEEKAQKEFVAKAKAHGYEFNTDFEMYISIDGKKEALTKEEMTDVIEGRVIPSTHERKEVKGEKHSKELDAFAKKEHFDFDNETHMYVTNNPFIKDSHVSIAKMKEKMESKAIEEKAIAKGYKPIIGMEGLFQNDKGDVKAADEF